MTDKRLKNIWETIASIPPGCVLSYGEVARLAGLPGRARLVGKALRDAPQQLQLPWHRVVNARGAISFPPDSSRHQRQRALLESEGVVFRNGRIDLGRFCPTTTLDETLWGPP